MRIFALAVVVAQVMPRGETGFDRNFVHAYFIVAGSLAAVAAEVGEVLLQFTLHAFLASPLYLFEHAG
jgi:hypothetical protein